MGVAEIVALAGIMATVITTILTAFTRVGILNRIDALEKKMESQVSRNSSLASRIALLKAAADGLVTKDQFHDLALSIRDNAHKVEQRYLELAYTLTDMSDQVSSKFEEMEAAIRVLEGQIAAVKKSQGNESDAERTSA